MSTRHLAMTTETQVVVAKWVVDLSTGRGFFCLQIEKASSLHFIHAFFCTVVLLHVAMASTTSWQRNQSRMDEISKFVLLDMLYATAEVYQSDFLVIVGSLMSIHPTISVSLIPQRVTEDLESILGHKTTWMWNTFV